MNDINIGSVVLEEELELGELELEDEMNIGELELDYIKEDPVDDYEKLKNLPSINNVPLKGNLTPEDLKMIIPKILKIFDIEYTYEDDEVYNANAIHQLLEIFGQEITNIVGLLDKKEDKQVYVDANVNFNANTGVVSLRNWVTEDPYKVIDEANQKGNPAILRVHLYANDQYMESLYMMQSIYSDTWWGHFKYFLGFVDGQSFAYLRINQNGSTTLNLKQL